MVIETSEEANSIVFHEKDGESVLIIFDDADKQSAAVDQIEHFLNIEDIQSPLNCAEEIQGLLDTYAESHPGSVLRLGPGLFLTGSLMIPSNITLHLDEGCILQATGDFDDYYVEPEELYMKVGEEMPLGWSEMRGVHLFDEGL